MSNQNNTRMLSNCREDFQLLSQHAGEVVKDCDRSKRSEVPLVRALVKFIRLTVIALRAARSLKPGYPEDTYVKEYLHKLVDEVFADVVGDLDEDEE